MTDPMLSLPWLVCLVPLFAGALLGFVRHPGTGSLINQMASVLAFLLALGLKNPIDSSHEQPSPPPVDRALPLRP